jgi:hypothetical protein
MEAIVIAKKKNSASNWTAPQAIKEAETIARKDVVRALDATAKAYKASKYGFRATTYYTLAFVYRRLVHFTRRRDELTAYVQKTSPGLDGSRLKMREAMRLCTIHAEGASTKAAIKLAEKHARALSQLYRERTRPSRVVSELRRRTIQGLANTGAKAKKSTEKRGTKASYSVKLVVPLPELDAALDQSGKALVTAVVERNAQGKVTITRQRVKPLREQKDD